MATSDILQAAAETLAEASAQFEEALKLLDKLQIDGTVGLDRDKPILDGPVSVNLIQIRLGTIENLLRTLPKDLSLVRVSVRQLGELRARTNEITQNVRHLFEHTKKVLADGGLKATSWSNVEIGNPQGNLNESFANRFLNPIFEATEGLIPLSNSLSLLAAPDAPSFSMLIERIARTNKTAAEEIDRLQKTRTQAEQVLANVMELTKKAEASTSAAVTSEASVKKIRDELAKLEGETRAKKSEADTTISAAASLKAQVDEYAAQFTSFKATLDERNTSWTKGKSDLDDLIGSLKRENDAIQEVVERAKSMLATATNAGLTAAQEDRYGKLNTELGNAERATYIAFALLFLSLSPLAAFVIANWNKMIPVGGGWDYAVNILVRSILLAPALLFVGFTTAQYRRLFRLKHEYGFRASLAGAVEGFKTQAPEHGEDIAAVAFYQLGRNPAEAIDGKVTNPPWYEKLSGIIERFSDRFGKKADGAG